ncbi:MAG TPA: hypothetical protein VGM43_27625 [Bryobacteraceae bacterium]|jgi:hypothetical protein
MKSLEVTLYEVFGYFLPGCIVLLSLWLVFHTAFWPRDPLILWQQLSKQGVAVLFFASYLLGHLAQALGNALQDFKFFEPNDLSLGNTEMDKCLRSAVSFRFKVQADQLSSGELYGLCDETLLHNKSLGEREIFTYREGFYRGVSIGLIILATSLLSSLILTIPIHVRLGATTTDMWPAPVIFLSSLSALGAYLALGRYKRFKEYRFRRCALRFLALATEQRSTNPPQL